MIIRPIKTRKFLPPKDDLWDLISSSITALEEESVVVITSKIVSISEGRCVKSGSVGKDELAKREAEFYLPRNEVPGKWLMHTLTKNQLIASAGIDKSNGGSFFILWPKNPQRSAKKIWGFLRKKYSVKTIGVVITDSHTVPLHRGLVGMCIGYFGFEPLRDYRGKKDIFGEELKMSQTNIPDSLASAAVFEMGEGNEQTPLAVISNLDSKIKFTGEGPATEKYNSFEVPVKEDLFYPFLKSVKWKRGKD